MAKLGHRTKGKMPQGRQSKPLSATQIARLQAYRSTHRLSIPVLHAAMAAPFQWRTLAHALEGRPIWVLNYDYIAAWVDRWCPPAPDPAPVDDAVKLATAGKDL